MDILHALQSDDSSEVIDALYELGAGKYGLPSPQVMEALTQLVDHPDSDVREEVAAAAGIRLRRPELYAHFLRRLQRAERESSVLPALINAAAALGLHGAGSRSELSTILCRRVLDEREVDDVRGTAYLALLKLWAKIAPKEYGRAPRALSETTWDRKFVSSLIGQGDSDLVG
jgi:hypothetical protein